MFFKKCKCNKKKSNKVSRKQAISNRYSKTQKKNLNYEKDKQYYDSLMQKYNKYGFLTYNEQVWLENNAYKFDY